MAVNNQVKALLVQALDLIDNEQTPSVPTPTQPTTPTETAGIVLEVVTNDPRGQIRIVADAKVVQGSKIRLANSQAFNVVGTVSQLSGISLISLDQKIGNVAAVTGKAYEIISTPVKSDTPAQTPSAPVETAPTPKPTPAPLPVTAGKLTNIAMLGLNFAAHANGAMVQPGEAGTHFKWFSKADVDFWVGQMGVRLIRWVYELQRSMVYETSTGLPSKTSELDSTFKQKVHERIEWIRAASNGEARIIFDPHHYWRIWRNETRDGKQTGALYGAEAGNQPGRWKKQERILIDDKNGWGAKELGLHLANFAREFDDPMVIGYGAGNEPYPSSGGLDAITWQEMERKVVADLNIALPILRTVTDKPVFTCGNWWASARNWPQFSSSFLTGIKDPNFIPEVHGYGDMDNGSSGKYEGSLNAFPTDQLTNVFKPAFSYFAAKGARCFIGETGIPATDSGRAMLGQLLDDAEKANVPVTLWVGAGDGAINDEKMSLDRPDHAKTREMLKPRFAKRFAEWTPVKG